jgi:hypothetical protein
MCIACEMMFWEAPEEPALAVAMSRDKADNAIEPFVCEVPDIKPVAQDGALEITNFRKREQDL